MQRYRVNHRLIIGLLVSSVVVVVAAYLLWSWQVNRKASWFRSSANDLAEAGNKEEAFEMLYKYVQLRDDEDDARIELAHIALDMVRDPAIARERRGQAYAYLQEAVRRTGDPELRLELAKILRDLMNRPQEALVQVEELLRDDPGNSELLEMQAKFTALSKSKRETLKLCYNLIGYDPVKDEFNPAKAVAKDRPDVYALTASLILDDNREDQELADRVIEQMLEYNPDSAKAHLNNSIYLRTTDRKEESDAELAKAYEIDPKNVDVLRQKALVAYQAEDFEEAEKFTRVAIEEHPDELRLYEFLATLLRDQKKYDEALAILDQGEKQLGSTPNLGFGQLRLNLLFMKGDVDAIEKELKRIEQLHVTDYEPLIAFNRARILWQQQKWSEAATALKKVRGNLLNFPQEHAMCGAMLASCYEKQGKFDLAKQVYKEVSDQYPNYVAAQQGLEIAKAKLGISEDTAGRDLEDAIQNMAALPKEEQDWSGILEQIEKLVEDRGLSQARHYLLLAQIEMQRERYDEARKLISQAAAEEPDNMDVYYAAISLLMNEPKSGAKIAIERLEKLEKKFGDSPRVRITRASILRELKPEGVVEKLEALTENMDAFSVQEQSQVESGVALQLEYLGYVDEANKHWERSTSLNSAPLPIHMHIFEVAFRNRDFEGMLEAEQKILELVGSESDANYILCHVRRKMIEYTNQKAEREELVEARSQLDVALKSRPEWADLHVLYGQVLLVLEEDTDLALKHLDEALQYGPANANALGLQVRILAQQGNIQAAYQKLQLIPLAVRSQVLGRAEAEVLLASGELEKAFRSAQELAEKEPQNPATQSWFADIATQSEQLDEAAAALEKAAELQSRDADIWLKLIATYAQQRNDKAIEETLQRAQLNIEADMLPLFNAKKYELLGDWQSAEKIYESAFASRMDELPILQRMAEFYLLWAKAGKVDANRANKYINQILERYYAGDAKRDNPTVVWARDKAARALAVTEDYQNFLKAEKLINPEGDSSKLTLNERSLLTEILSRRPEPESQKKAMTLLSEMHKRNEISKAGILELAKLLSRSNNWERAQELLLDSITQYNNDEQLWATFIDLLIERGEYSTASTRLNRFRSLHPKSPSAAPLTIKLASRSGDQARLEEILASILPSRDRALTKQQLDTILSMARLLTEYDQTDKAAELYEIYIQRDPSRMAEYTSFLARHGDPEKAMELVRQQFPENMEPMLRVAIGLLRERRPEVGDKYDAEIEEMVARALREDPESIARLMMQAELWEISGQYDKAIDAYDKLLERNDLNRVARAAAMNNLGFMLALEKVRMEEADELITKAIEIYGPISDILDTRAVVRMAGENYDGAAQDMELATAFSDDPVKFYHSARANMLAGNTQAALKAWERSLALGIEKAKVPLAEQSEFEQVREQIEGLRTQSAGL